jgi:hypothetical protein
MSLKALAENAFFSKLVYTVAGAAIIGGGTVVLNNQARIAVLENTSIMEDERLQRIENKIDQLLLR